MAKREPNELKWFMPVEIELFFGSVWAPYMKDFQKWWFMSLLLNAWRNSEKPCHLPNDQNRLWMLAGADSQKFFAERGAIVIDRFDVTEDGRWLVNSKQFELYQEKLTNYRKSESAGRAGAEARWGKNSESMRSHNDSNATVCHISTSISSSPSDVPVSEVAFEVQEPPKKIPEKFVKPEWIPEEPWTDWLALRKQKGAPNTTRALKTAAKRLEQICETGVSPEDAINEAILRGWVTFWPPRETPKNSTATVGMNDRWS